MSKRHYVYRMTRTNGEYYIGIRSCCGDPWDDVKYTGSGTRLRRSVKKHPDQWAKTILCELPSREGCARLEHALVPLWRVESDPLCLNLKEGGEDPGCGQHTEETRIRLGNSLRGRKLTGSRLERLLQWNASPEGALARKSAQAKRRRTGVSKETAEKIGAAKRGRPLSEAHRQALSAVRRGVPKSAQHRAAMTLGQQRRRFPARLCAAMRVRVLRIVKTV